MKLMRNLAGTAGFLLVLVGSSAMDSDRLSVPIVIIAAGVILIALSALASEKKKPP